MAPWNFPGGCPSGSRTYAFAAAGGLRRGEVFALRRADVDFAGPEITVRRSKTDAGSRTVPMFRSVRKDLA